MAKETLTSDRQLIEQLKAELTKFGFHKGSEQFPDIEYCRYCHYSKEWTSRHGHAANCLLRSITDEGLNS